MPFSIPVELWDDVREQAIAELRELGPDLIGAMLSTDGGAPGDEPLSRSDRILQFMDDARSGALDILMVQSAWRYEERVRQFKADMAAESRAS